MAETSVKDEVRKLVERLPEDATWEEAADLIAMHERLARARRESAAGQKVSLEEVEKEFGFSD
jgi:hypothetical protein